jgi:hypothetical protein
VIRLTGYRSRLAAIIIIATLPAACSAARTQVSAPAPTGAHCFATDRLEAADRALADSLLAHALDNEALFTLAGPLKPISSVHALRLRVARPAHVPPGTRDVVHADSPELARMERYQRVANVLHCGSVRMVVVPYRAAHDSLRTVQISAVDAVLLDSVIHRDRVFWGQWGIVPGSDPAVVVAVTESGEAYDRFRGYGYLFGYPEHAVSFFVEAAREGAARGGQLIERDFLHIPVHSRQTGRFVYAVPRGHTPGPDDEEIRHRAAAILAEYEMRRSRYVNPDGTLRASDLLRDWYAERRLNAAVGTPRCTPPATHTTSPTATTRTRVRARRGR